MDTKEILNRNIERAGWGLLAILWGAVILFDFVPLAVGLIGTGLILLGANAIRQLNQFPARSENTTLGIILLIRTLGASQDKSFGVPINTSKE